jgi:hypothetical protein
MPNVVHDTIRASVARATHSGFFHKITLPHTRAMSFLDAPAGTVVEVRHPYWRSFFHQMEVEVCRERRLVAREYRFQASGLWTDDLSRPEAEVPQAVRDLAAGVGPIHETTILDRRWYKVVDRDGTVVGLLVDDIVHPIQDEWPIGGRRVDMRRLEWPEGAQETALFVPGYCDDVAYLEKVPA